MSSLYTTFRQTIGRDGPDFSWLDSLDEQQKEKLTKSLTEECEYFNILALGFLKCRSAVEQLKRWLASDESDVCLAASRALWDIEQSEAMLKPICKWVRQGESPQQKSLAIGLLAQVRTPLVFDTLLDALLDSDYLIRRYAASVLSLNSSRKTSESTIKSNLLEFDQDRISAFSAKMRAKI